MRFFYDTEFIEDGRTIDLISIGIVAEDGSEYYAVNASAPWGRIFNHTWLRENVLPSLPLGPARLSDYAGGRKLIGLDTTNPAVKDRVQIAREVALFLRGPVAPWWPVQLWADYGAYDHVALCQLFGSMVDLPEGLPMWTHDFQQLLEAAKVGQDALPKQADGHHNALADARHLKASWDYGFKAGWWS